VPRGAGPPPGEPVQSPKPRTRPGDWGSGACQSGLISRTGERLVDLGSTTGLADRELDRERDRGRDRGRDRDPGSTSGRFEDDDESPAHLPRPPDLAGRVAVVTGGSRGIGAATARALADNGAAVAVVGRDEPALAAVADGIAARGVRVNCLAPSAVENDMRTWMTEQQRRELAASFPLRRFGASANPMTWPLPRCSSPPTPRRGSRASRSTSPAARSRV
jgi:hypothetical protein